jgi:hypothetical protein
MVDRVSGDGILAIDQPRVMFVTYGAGHVDIVAHLLPALKEQNLPEPVVLALTTAPLRLAHSACTLKRCTDYLPMRGYEHAEARGVNLARGVWLEGSDVSWEETCAYLGVSMCDLEAEVGLDQAQKSYEEMGRKVFCPVRFMERVLERERPDIVVTTCHVRMERAAVIAARNLGIRSVRIEDLLGYSLLGVHPYGKAGNLIHASEQPDMAVVMNAAVKEIIVRNGFPARRVVPLGQPVFSEWKAQYLSSTPTDIFKGAANTKPIVTYMTTPREDIMQSQSGKWIALARHRPDINFVIKLHPSTAEKVYRKQYGPFPENLRVLSEEPALNVVKASDLIVLLRSTVGVLCLMTSTPMIVWDTTGEGEVLPYVTSGAAQIAEDDDDLERLIDRMLKAHSLDRMPLPHPLFEISDDAAVQIASWLKAGAPECVGV